jgi:ADP-ribose pyrophosphatase YjhB (NUDIX family)
MELNQAIREHYLEGDQKYLRHLSVDCIIFGFHENQLKVLLLHAKRAAKWALPGGFILKTEHMDDAAKRILMERTGLEDIFMQQFHVFSAPARSQRRMDKALLNTIGIAGKNSWMFERFITVGYTALIDFSEARPQPDVFSSECEWFDIHQVPKLILDHEDILRKALDHLQMQLNYHPIGYNLLPEKFTMPELQTLYETILDKKLDRRNFQRKLLATGILTRLNETKTGVAHKAAYFYTFDKNKYDAAQSGSIGFNL